MALEILKILYLETGVNNELVNQIENPDRSKLPDDVIIEHVGDMWNDAFRPDFIFSPDNINRLDEFDRHDHDDAGAGRFGGSRGVSGFGGGRDWL